MITPTEYAQWLAVYRAKPLVPRSICRLAIELIYRRTGWVPSVMPTGGDPRRYAYPWVATWWGRDDYTSADDDRRAGRRVYGRSYWTAALKAL